MIQSVKALTLAGRALTGAAAAVALYLAVMSLGRTALPGCESASACQDALTSQWAYVFGMPVSFAGVVLYSTMLWMSSAFLRRQGNLADATGWAAAVLIPLAALWFTGVQALLLERFCPWCCLAHGLAVTGVAMLWMSRRKMPPATEVSTPRGRGIRRVLISAGVLGGATALVAGALTGTPPHAAPLVTQLPAPAAGSDAEQDAASIDPAAFPLMGRSDATATSFLLSDFTCQHCLELHAAIDALAQRRGTDFRVVVLPAARTPEAAAIQRTLLALWHIDPAKWHSAAALLSSKQIEATPEAVEKTAIQLVGAERLAGAAQESAPRIGAQLNAAARLQAEQRHQTGQGILPKLIRGDRVLSGAETDPAKLSAFLTDGAAAKPVFAKNANDPRRERETGPLIAILNPEMDLKAMTAGKPVDVEIKVQNRGNRPLQLGWLETDKGCFVTSLPAENIRPGGMAAIGLRVHPPEKAGAALKRSIRIHSNSPGKPGEIVLHSTLAAAATPAPPSAAPRTASVQHPIAAPARKVIP